MRNVKHRTTTFAFINQTFIEGRSSQIGRSKSTHAARTSTLVSEFFFVLEKKMCLKFPLCLFFIFLMGQLWFSKFSRVHIFLHVRNLFYWKYFLFVHWEKTVPGENILEFRGFLLFFSGTFSGFFFTCKNNFTYLISCNF